MLVLHYLILIEASSVLQPLYGHVLLPESVQLELQNQSAPAVVRQWVFNPPPWCEIRPDPPDDPELMFLDPGERAAIALALSTRPTAS
jgi:hypothetical protein